MKKDFTQPFEYKGTHAFLLLQDTASGLFIIFADPEDVEEYGEESAYHTFSINIASKTQGAISLQLARFLTDKGYVLNSFQELARKTSVSYSFVDDTPGSEQDTIAIHAQVDIVDKEKFKEQFGVLVSLEEFAEHMASAMIRSTTVDLATTQLLEMRHYRISNLAQGK
jgi:hypothetical protein